MEWVHALDAAAYSTSALLCAGALLLGSVAKVIQACAALADIKKIYWCAHTQYAG
jgi:hypothetical protein